MGAGKESEAERKAIRLLSVSGTRLILEQGWEVRESPEGQLLLVPPPLYGAPDGEAA